MSVARQHSCRAPALRCGAGLCRLPSPVCPIKFCAIFGAAFSEATAHSLPCDQEGRLVPEAADALPEIWKNAQVVALGPGLSRRCGRSRFREARGSRMPTPIGNRCRCAVCVAGDIAGRSRQARAAPTVLTPHPGGDGRVIANENERSTGRYVPPPRWPRRASITPLWCSRGHAPSSPIPGAELWFNLTGK